jgi:hypothetical protein
MSRYYLAGPLRSPDPEQQARNIEAARAVHDALWLDGHQVYSPHVLTGHLVGLVGLVGEELAFEFHIRMLGAGRWDGLVLLPHWRESYGTAREITIARRLNIPLLLGVDLRPVTP